VCTVFLALGQHPQYPVILAANRDEFYQRPSRPSAWRWRQRRVLAGLDVKEQGTWMGVRRDGHSAVLTNYRNPKLVAPARPSRGLLLRDVLLNHDRAENKADRLLAAAADYNPFNVILNDASDWYYISSVQQQKRRLNTGLYGLSNAHLDTAWPKVNAGKKQLTTLLRQTDGLAELKNGLFALLGNPRRAADEELPTTGIPLAWERVVSALFIRTDGYGTRFSTLLIIDREKKAHWYERQFDDHTMVGQKSFSFHLTT
jgi:uncharacterized protein with NRDE domain